MLKPGEHVLGLIAVSNNPVTLARSILKCFTLQDFERTACLYNNPPRFKSRECIRYPWPTDTEHRSQSVMRYGQFISIDAI